MLFDGIAIGFLSGTAILSSWLFYQNTKTRNDRLKLIDWVFTQSDWRILSNYLDEVSYDRHFWYRLTFRDPAQLYNPKLRDTLK